MVLPKRLTELKSRLDRTLILWIEHARTSLGIRRGLHAPNAYFKELTAERLARALSPRGEGLKKYRVTFDDGGPKQIIRCSRERCYADLMGPDHLHRLERVAQLIRPGSRILEITTPPMLTGYTADYLARMVGDSGAVVSLLADEEGAKFAPRRYVRPNLSIEPLTGSVQEALAGETDNSFHAIVHLGLPEDARNRDALMREMLRVLIPGGWMLAGVRLTNDPTDEAIQNLRAHLASVGQIIPGAGGASGPLLDVVLSKAVADMGSGGATEGVA
jgi:protein-L-isoaspartate O-methyltransferase